MSLANDLARDVGSLLLAMAPLFAIGTLAIVLFFFPERFFRMSDFLRSVSDNVLYWTVYKPLLRLCDFFGLVPIEKSEFRRMWIIASHARFLSHEHSPDVASQLRFQAREWEGSFFNIWRHESGPPDLGLAPVPDALKFPLQEKRHEP